MTHDSEASQQVSVQLLEWGQQQQITDLLQIITERSATSPTSSSSSSQYPDYVLGSDLIYAKENISALVSTYSALCDDHTIAYLVYIPRFDSEQQFFTEMQERGFESHIIYQQQEEIFIYQFNKKHTGRADRIYRGAIMNS